MGINSTFRAAGMSVLAGALLLSGETGRKVWGQDTEELLLFGRHNFGLSTARSAAMGGAFTSLGADVLSLSLNPAGIAMYSAGEVSFTPGMKVGAGTTDYSGRNFYNGLNESVKENKSRTLGNVGSMGVVYAARGANDSENSFAIGFGMNRLADFNRRTRTTGFAEEWSIADMFAAQLMYGTPIPGGTIGSPDDDIYQAFRRYPPGLWGAIMGYQAELFDPLESDDARYSTANIFSPGVMIYPQRNRETEGAINEYAVSGGFNLGSVLYLGMTVGIQDVYYDRYDTYTEITYMPDGSDNVGLSDLTYRQKLSMGGTGVNVKIGATVRPVSWLRIGLAYHSPTWINMNEEYSADLTVFDFRYRDEWGDLVPGFSDTPFYRQDYNMRTASRLTAGISATWGTVGIVSVDYERTWYNKMKYTGRGYEDLNDVIADAYRAVNILRTGIELQPFRSFFVRGGFGFSSSPYKGTSSGEYKQYSGGLGYRNRAFSVDLAYVYGTTEQLPEKLYSTWANHDPVTGAPVAEEYLLEPSGTAAAKVKNHNLMLTVGIRF